MGSILLALQAGRKDPIIQQAMMPTMTDSISRKVKITSTEEGRTPDIPSKMQIIAMIVPKINIRIAARIAMMNERSNTKKKTPNLKVKSISSRRYADICIL